MNNMMEKNFKNEEVLGKIVGAAVKPVSTEISTDIQALEKKVDKIISDHSKEIQAAEKSLETFCSNRSTEAQALEKKLETISLDFNAKMQAYGEKMEKFFLEQISKVDELKNVNFNRNDASDNDLSNRIIVSQSKHNSSRKEMIAEKVNIFKEKTIPLSVLKIMKEIIVEQQQSMFFNHFPSSLISGTDVRGDVLYSCQPMRHEPEFHLYDYVFHPSFYENSFGSLSNSSLLQSGDLAAGKCITDSSKMEREKVGPSYDTVQQRLHKNEKRKSEEAVENNFYDMFGSSKKKRQPTVLQEEFADSSKELMFLGKNEDNGLKLHKISHPEQLEDLKKKYKSYKILRTDDF